MSRRYSVLVVTKNDFSLRRDGGSKRTAAIVDEMTSRGWQVDWIAARPAAASPGSTRTGRRPGITTLIRTLATRSLSVAKWYSSISARRVEHAVRTGAHDAIVLEHPQLIAYLPERSDAVLVADFHNVESELLANYGRSESGVRRLAARYESRRLAAIERRLVRSVDLAAVVSSHDETQLLGERGGTPDRVVVAANGVEDDFYQAAGPRADTAVFIGHLGWRPNVDAAQWLVGGPWSAARAVNPALSLELVGRSPDRAVITIDVPGVTVAADVPSVLPHLTRARCATAPLLSAGGTRIKILEALAAGTPVVATSLGALGLEHLAGEHLVIEDDPERFGRALARLARQDADRSEVRTLVADYRWSTVLAPLMQRLEVLLEARQRA